jgi:hypothetical protein
MHFAPPLRGSVGVLGIHFPTLKRGANKHCAYGAIAVESILQAESSQANAVVGSFVVSHPRRKNRDAPRVGHPVVSGLVVSHPSSKGRSMDGAPGC